MKHTIQLRPFSEWLAHHWHVLAILGIVLLFFRIRLSGDEDHLFSIGTDETDSYLEASQIPSASWEFFTSIRPVTLPIILKVIEPEKGYKLTVISNPAREQNSYQRKAQRGFDRIVLVQLAFSILGWGALAVSVSRHLEHRLLKVLAATIILLFAISHPVSDWDSVLDSFSLTFSLLALTLALLVEIAFSLQLGHKGSNPKAGFLIALCLITMLLLVFVRDSNQYILPITALFLLTLLLLRPMRRLKIPIVILALTALFVFGFGLVTARQSMRWKNPLSHAYEFFIYLTRTASNIYRKNLVCQTLVHLGSALGSAGGLPRRIWFFWPITPPMLFLNYFREWTFSSRRTPSHTIEMIRRPLPAFCLKR